MVRGNSVSSRSFENDTPWVGVPTPRGLWGLKERGGTTFLFDMHGLGGQSPLVELGSHQLQQYGKTHKWKINVTAAEIGRAIAAGSRSRQPLQPLTSDRTEQDDPSRRKKIVVGACFASNILWDSAERLVATVPQDELPFLMGQTEWGQLSQSTLSLPEGNEYIRNVIGRTAHPRPTLSTVMKADPSVSTSNPVVIVPRRRGKGYIQISALRAASTQA